MPKVEVEKQLDLVNLGLAIAHHRRKLALSQSKLSEMAFVHRTYLSNIERGEQNVSIQTLVRIANSLNLSTSELIKFAELYDDHNGS